MTRKCYTLFISLLMTGRFFPENALFVFYKYFNVKIYIHVHTYCTGMRFSRSVKMYIVELLAL